VQLVGFYYKNCCPVFVQSIRKGLHVTPLAIFVVNTDVTEGRNILMGAYKITFTRAPWKRETLRK